MLNTNNVKDTKLLKDAKMKLSNYSSMPNIPYTTFKNQQYLERTLYRNQNIKK